MIKGIFIVVTRHSVGLVSAWLLTLLIIYITTIFIWNKYKPSENVKKLIKKKTQELDDFTKPISIRLCTEYEGWKIDLGSGMTGNFSDTVVYRNIKFDPTLSKILVKGLESSIDSSVRKMIKYLNLSHCQINEECCEILVPTLKKMVKLEDLNLSYNQIDDTCCKILAPALEKMVNLKYLYVEGNKITDKGYEYLNNFVENITTIEDVPNRAKYLLNKEDSRFPAWFINKLKRDSKTM